MKELTIKEKAQRYDEAIKRANSLLSSNELGNAWIYKLLPELKESEDEKIRGRLIKLVKMSNEVGGFALHKWEADEMIAWLEKQGRQKPLYIRFGDVPSNETSKIYRGEVEIGDENGVSVYPAFEVNGNIVLGLTLPITKTTLYTQQHLLEYDNRPCYLVSGDYVGKGTDGEPLIRNITIIKRLDNYRIKDFEKQGEQKLNGTFVNVDDVREDFVQEVYRVLDADSTNDRANQIIDAFDDLPTVAIEKQGNQKPAEFDDTNAKRMFIKALERVEEQNAKGYKLTDCDKNSWWEDFKNYTFCTIEQKPADKIEPKFKV